MILVHQPYQRNIIMNTRLSSTLIILVVSLWLSGCDMLGGDEGSGATLATSIIVANGGNFSDQNGTLTFYDPSTQATTESSSRAGFVQGLLDDDRGLVTLINTFGQGRIDILDPSSLETTGQYTDISNPRDAVSIDDVLWVSTSTFGEPGQLIAFNAQGTKLSASTVGFVPEGVASWSDQLVVANNGSLGSGSTLSIVSEATGEVRSVETGCDGPRDVYTATFLVVVCTGKTVYSADFTQILEQTPGQVLFMDNDFEVVSRIVLPAQAGSTNGTETGFYSEQTDELFVTLSATEMVLIIDLEGRSVSQTLELAGHPTLVGLSGIAYDAGRDQLYLGRFPQASAGPFPDYAASGTVQVMNREGVLLHSFGAGVSISAITLR